MKDFTSIFVENSNKKLFSDNDLFFNLTFLIKNLENLDRKTTVINPKQIMKSIKSMNELFNNDYHHDSHEFLMWLLDYLQEEHTKFFSKDSFNPFNNLFMGIKQNVTKCLTCNSVTKSKEKYYDLSLDIKNNVSLTYCLRLFSQKEILKGKNKFYCDICNNHIEAERR